MRKWSLCLLTAVLAVSASGQATNPVERAASDASPVEDVPLHANVDEIYNIAVEGLSAYKPVYFVVGERPAVHAKFTLSFKSRLFKPTAFKGGWQHFNKLYGAYSQESFWDLSTASVPMEDNNYNPEVFYLNWDTFGGFWPENVRMVLQSGYEHESNGRSGIDSRSWDRLYFQPSWVMGAQDGYQLTVGTKLWTIINEGDNNKDIEDYLGYGELYLKYGKLEGIMLDLLLRKGTKGGNGAVQLNVSYPMGKLLHNKLNLYLFGQAYYGEGDSLLYYDYDISSLRIGAAFIR